MILITGAAGKTGKALLQSISNLKVESPERPPVRALVRRGSQIADALADGAQEALVSDMRNPSDVATAVAGVSVVYAICPNMQPDEIEIMAQLIESSRAAGVERIVYHSVLHPQTESMPHHWRKLRVEERLFECGLGYTILQPAAYMQNVLAGWQAIVAHGEYRVPYAVTTTLGMVDLADVAEAGATVLTEAGHVGAIYELATSEWLTQIQVAQVLSESIGRRVQAVEIERTAWEEQAVSAGLSPYAVDTLKKMFLYYEKYGFGGNDTVLKSLLGRNPTTFGQFAEALSGMV